MQTKGGSYALTAAGEVSAVFEVVARSSFSGEFEGEVGLLVNNLECGDVAVVYLVNGNRVREGWN